MGREKYGQTTRVSSHATIEAAYAELDRIAETRHRHGFPEDWLEIYKVDDNRSPAPRPICH